MRKQSGQHIDCSLVGPREEELFKPCLEWQPTETEIINVCCSKPLSGLLLHSNGKQMNALDNPTIARNKSAGLFLFLLILSRSKS